jgi:hypothetical protein
VTEALGCDINISSRAVLASKTLRDFENIWVELDGDEVEFDIFVAMYGMDMIDFEIWYDELVTDLGRNYRFVSGGVVRRKSRQLGYSFYEFDGALWMVNGALAGGRLYLD